MAIISERNDNECDLPTLPACFSRKKWRSRTPNLNIACPFHSFLFCQQNRFAERKLGNKYIRMDFKRKDYQPQVYNFISEINIP